MAYKVLNTDGSPAKFQDKEVFGADFVGVVKAVDLERRTMIMTGTDESKDRDGDIIRLSGWQLDNYRKNPVFLWAHNYGSVPLASAEKVVRKREPARMDFHLRYPTASIYPFADMILSLYGEKIINASSVGFIPFKWADLKPEGEDEAGVRRTWGREFTLQELLELSGCAVPCNPNALQNALTGKGFKGVSSEDMVKWLMGKSPILKPDRVDDILEEFDKLDTEIVDETLPTMVQVPKEFENVQPTAVFVSNSSSSSVEVSSVVEEEGHESPKNPADGSGQAKAETPVPETEGTFSHKEVMEFITSFGITLTGIKESIQSISRTMESIAEKVNNIGSQASQALANDTSRQEPSVVGASSLVLEEAFNGVKTPPPSSTLINQEGIKVLTNSVKELAIALEGLKSLTKRR